MNTNRPLLRAVARVRRRRRAGVASAAAAVSSALVGVAVLCAVALSAPFGWPWGAASGAVLFGLAGYAAWRFLGRDLWRRARGYAALRDAEKQTPPLRRRLFSAFNLAAAGPGPYGASAALADAFVAEVERAAAGRLRAPLPRRTRFISAALFGGAVGAWVIIGLAAPDFLAGRWAALAAASPLEEGPFAEITPGDARVGANRDFAVRARLRGDVAGKVAVVVERGGGDAEVLMAPQGPRTYAASFAAGAEDFRYYVVAGDERSRSYKVRVMPPPAITGVQVRITPPAYATLPPRALSPGEGDVTALAGSVVSVEARAEGAAEVALVPAGSAKITARHEGDVYAGDFVVKRNGTYRVVASSPWGDASSPAYQITVMPDLPPEVAITAPARDLVLADASRAPALRFTCADDFGLGDVRAVYYNETSGERLVGEAGTGTGRRALEGETPLVPPTLGIYPGDVVAYYVEAYDNDAVNGPKAGRSETYRFRFPTAADLFEKTNEELNAGVADLEELRGEVHDFQEQLKKMEAEGDKGQPDRPQLRALAGEQERLRRALADAAAKLQETLDRADENALSPALAAKLVEANRILNEVLTQQQKETLAKLNEALRQVDPEKVRGLMAQIKLDQAELERRLEQTLSVLKEAQREELLRNLTARAEDLLARQRDVNDEVRAGKADAPTARAQEEVVGDIKELGGSMKEAATAFDEVDAKTAAALRELAAECAIGKAPRAAEETAASLNAGDMAKAAAAGELTEQELKDLAAELRELSDKYGENKRRALLADLDRAIERTLAASHRAESLARELTAEEGDAGFAGKAENVAAEAAALAASARGAAAKSLFVPPVLGDALAAAGAELDAAARNYELGNGRAAQEGSLRAVAGLNLAAAALLEARGNAANSGSSSGLAEMLERMKALAEGQRGVNEQGQSLFSLMPGMSPSALAQALAELAAEQALIRKGLDELAGKAPGAEGKENGELGGMAKDMEEIQKDLAGGKLDKRILEKQEKLLERMLTATRSLRVQGRTSRRRSTPGGDYATPAVAPLPARLTAPRVEATPASGPPTAGDYVPADLRDAVADYFRRLAGGE